MMEENVDFKTCPVSGCNKDLSEQSQHNKDLHIKTCKKKHSIQKDKVDERCKKRTHGTINYFFGKSSKISKTTNATTNLVTTEVPSENPCVPSQTQEDSTIIAPSCSNTEVVSIDDDPPPSVQNYCKGYVPDVSNVFHNFPFQLLEDANFVHANNSFHDKKCAAENYKINSCVNINDGCKRLEGDLSMQKIIERSKLEEPEPQMNNIYLTFTQLKSKIEKLQQQKSLLMIEKYRANEKANKLGKTLSLYKRFVLEISQNNIPRLQNLVNVALRNRRSINYILEKCTLAISGIYKARASEDDKDLAFIVLKFGGPALLDILYRANHLPSSSLAYRMSKNCKPLSSSVSLSFRECFENNAKPSTDDNIKFSYSIKSDETYINGRLRYNSKDNEIVGCCYEHSECINLKLNEFSDVELVQKKLTEDAIHVPKECLVTGISALTKNTPFDVILMWPTCSKDDFDGMAKMYYEISKSLLDKVGAPAINFCTDGDSTRRQALHAITDNQLDLQSDLGKIIGALHLVDQTVGKNNETKNFDVKHLVKRCWTSLISDKLEVGGVTIMKADLKCILQLSEKRTHEVESLLYPKDKQNVPSASDCLLSFIEVIMDPGKNKNIPFKLIPIINFLKMVACIYDALMCLYSYVEYSLSQQIVCVSTAAYCFLSLFRETMINTPTQLYHDIQCTFIDTVYCIAKLQIYSPESSFYTALNGTDPAERFFGNCYMAYGYKNLDALELVNCASSISACDEILKKHPEWVKKGRASRRLVLDHSSTKDWTSDLMVKNVNIGRKWKVGMLEAEKLITLCDIDFDVYDLKDIGVTLLKPDGKVVGVKERDVDWSIVAPEEPEDVAEDEDELSITDVTMDNKADNFLEIDGTNVYKSTLLKNISKDQPLSKDRLKKVRGISKYCLSTEADSADIVDMNDILSIGDPLIVSYSDKQNVSIITKILHGQNEISYIRQVDMHNIAIKLQVRTLEMVEVDKLLFWSGKYASPVFSVSGKDCLSIEPQISAKPPEGCSSYFFDKQLIQDIGVHIVLSHNNVETQESTKCKICKKKVNLKDMRVHVGAHIIKRDIRENLHDICGFCGKHGCHISLEETSHKGKKKFFSPKSECVYFFPYKKLGDVSSRKNPCTNKISNCKKCNMCIWTYNMVHHYTLCHKEDACDLVVSKKEIDAMKKL